MNKIIELGKKEEIDEWVKGREKIQKYGEDLIDQMHYNQRQKETVSVSLVIHINIFPISIVHCFCVHIFNIIHILISHLFFVPIIFFLLLFYLLSLHILLFLLIFFLLVLYNNGSLSRRFNYVNAC
jgi:hypothetical protein